MPKFSADTMLERFIRKHKLTILDVVHESKVSRQQLLRIRRGEADPGYWTALRIRDACSRLLRRVVSIEELFGPTDPQAARLREKRKM